MTWAQMHASDSGQQQRGAEGTSSRLQETSGTKGRGTKQTQAKNLLNVGEMKGLMKTVNLYPCGLK